MSDPIRLTVVMTHPVQYLAPWFRYLASEVPELALTVLYATAPTESQQGTGFGRAFRWDVPLTEGYDHRVLAGASEGRELSSDSFRGVNVAGIDEAILETAPGVVLVPGWHSVTLTRAIDACRRFRIPLLYRGDTHEGTAPGGWRRPLWRLATRRRLARYDGWLAVGSRARSYLERFAPTDRRIFDSPHAVDNERFAGAAERWQSEEARSEARDGLGVAGDAPVLLFVGKLSPIKRPLDLIRAAALLEQPARLLFVGGGDLEPVCRDEARRLGVEAVWAGFLNQQELPRAYAAADALVLPSASESWGLVVNEALASGLPCVVSDGVGCAPDLIEPGKTGERFATGDVGALAEALERQLARPRATFAEACRTQVATHDYARASAGLVEACRALAPRPTAEMVEREAADRLDGTRVLAPCGGMVIVAGLERQTFELLRTLTDAGASVHCLLNDWESHRIEPLAEAIGASWARIPYRGQLTRRLNDPVRFVKTLWQMGRTSRALAREASAFAPTHLLLPEIGALLRALPAIRRLRRRGVRVLLRVGNAPERGRFYRFLWRRVIAPNVDLCVANSHFGLLRLRQEGVPPGRTTLVRNRVARRPETIGQDHEVIERARKRPTLLTLGQLAPFKGTHLAVEAALALLERGHDVQAILVGRKPEWPPEYVQYLAEMEERVAAAGQGDRVRFVGERSEVASILEAATLLVAPILQEETFGNVVLEAASVGLPAVVFPRGGLPELVDDGETGWICPEPTLDSLVATLERALGEPARLEAAGRRAGERTADPEGPYSAQTYRRGWLRLFS